MAEVLSQSQIDALLNSMAGGDEGEAPAAEAAEEKDNYRKYDFYSPKKFTKDRLKMINSVYDNFARVVSSQLNGLLRVNAELEVVGVEEQRYHEFANALTENDVMMLLDLSLPDESKNPPIITHINQILMVNMIDRMLGGPGDNNSIDAWYDYTDIEISLYQKVMGYVLNVTKDAWSNYIKLGIKNLRLEENPSLYQEIRFDEPVAIVMLKVTMQDIEGRLSICIPGNLLDSIFTVIDRKQSAEGLYDNVSNEGKFAIMKQVKRSALTVEATLGTAQLNVRDVCTLKVGDVIDLNKPKDSCVYLLIDKKPWFEGELGVMGKNVAIKIDKRFNPEGDDEPSDRGVMPDIGQVAEIDSGRVEDPHGFDPALSAESAEEQEANIMAALESAEPELEEPLETEDFGDLETDALEEANESATA